MSIEIKLLHNKVVIVDDDKFDEISKHAWYVDSGGYAISRINIDGKIKLIRMHSMLLNHPKGMFTDHINRNRLDNRLSNLRIVDAKGNVGNMKTPSHNTSGYKGVSKARGGRWRAYIKHNRVQKHLGHFTNIKDAAIAYNNAAIEYFGSYAKLNEVSL